MLEHRMVGEENDMGVYIKGLSKPKSCGECRFESTQYVNNYCRRTFCNLDLGADYEHCPLIEIDPYNWANDLVFVVAEIEKARERLYKVSKIECERKRNDSNT